MVKVKVGFDTTRNIILVYSYLCNVLTLTVGVEVCRLNVVEKG